MEQYASTGVAFAGWQPEGRFAVAADMLNAVRG